MIISVFIYAGLLTVLWAVAFQWIHVSFPAAFEPVLNTALGVIIIQIVYGFLYRRIWGYRLSEQWPGDRPNYFIFATLIGVFAAAWPQESSKPWVVALIVLLLVFYPFFWLRSRLAAYVLIRVAPGYTEAVHDALNKREIGNAVLYGSLDLIAHIDIGPQNSKEEALLELTRRVKQDVRSVKGIIETETLVDFSRLASFRLVASSGDRHAAFSGTGKDKEGD
jgi:hypothetical protein